jgi:hypothetical protein
MSDNQISDNTGATASSAAGALGGIPEHDPDPADWRRDENRPRHGHITTGRRAADRALFGV